MLYYIKFINIIKVSPIYIDISRAHQLTTRVTVLPFVSVLKGRCS